MSPNECRKRRNEWQASMERWKQLALRAKREGNAKNAILALRGYRRAKQEVEFYSKEEGRDEPLV